MSNRDEEERVMRQLDRIRRLRDGEAEPADVLKEELSEGDDARLRVILEEGGYMPPVPSDARDFALAAANAAYRRRSAEEGLIGRLRSLVESTRAEVAIATAGAAVVAALALVVILDRPVPSSSWAGIARTTAEAEVVEWTLALAEVAPPQRRGAVVVAAAEAWDLSQGRGREDRRFGQALRAAADEPFEPTAELQALEVSPSPIAGSDAAGVLAVVVPLLSSAPATAAPSLNGRAKELAQQLPPASVSQLALVMARLWARSGYRDRAEAWLSVIDEAEVVVDPAILEQADALRATFTATRSRGSE